MRGRERDERDGGALSGSEGRAEARGSGSLEVRKGEKVKVKESEEKVQVRENECGLKNEERMEMRMKSEAASLILTSCRRP